MTDRVVMHVFSYPGYVTASELGYLLRNGGTCRAQELPLRANRLAIKGLRLCTSSPTANRLARSVCHFRSFRSRRWFQGKAAARTACVGHLLDAEL